MRRALVVGIDDYDVLRPLSGCVNDARAVAAALERHADGTLNFPTPKVLAGTSSTPVMRTELREAIQALFADPAEIALLYFSGHGHVESAGGFLCASDSANGADGVALSEVMTWANGSSATNKIVLLDSCFAGAAGTDPLRTSMSELADGLTVMTAATGTQLAYEAPGGGSGIFTNLLVDALNGAAANLLGEVTPGSVYAHIDKSLGIWAQRPVFKTNVQSFVSLRKADAPIQLSALQSLPVLFPTAHSTYALDPSYEPERSAGQEHLPLPDPTNNLVFRTLQDLVRVNLVRPVDAPHMWHAAMESKGCELTVLGVHYWNLASSGQL